MNKLKLIILCLVAFTLSAHSLPNALIVSWEIPTTYEDGVELDQTNITGFDIYLIKDGVKEYAKWFEWNETAVAEYSHAITGAGEYCFYLVTVSKDNGKSAASETVCLNVEDKPPTTNARPAPPSGLKISIGGDSAK